MMRKRRADQVRRGHPSNSEGVPFLVLFLKDISSEASAYNLPELAFEASDKATVVNTLEAYMNENYMKEITLDTISKSMYMSPVYISKVFKEEAGFSPINSLIKICLAKASELLSVTGLPVKAVGYDAYYFSKLFKKYRSESPVKSRKRTSRSK
jgi:YesN/AraC family two-component response regulator